MQGDPRLVRRASAFAEAFARRPDRALPHVVDSDAEREGMYRMLRNDRLGFEELVEAQQHRTRERALQAKRVVVVHDTTECSFAHADGDEVGWLNQSRPGFLVHHSLVLDTNARPLGVIWSTAWARPKPKGRGRKKRLSGKELARQESRESDRWIESVEQSGAWLSDVDCVHIMDREADNFRLLEDMIANGHELIVRLCYPRRARHASDDEWTALPELFCERPPLFEREVKLSRRVPRSTPRIHHPARAAREATLTARAGSLWLKPPPYLSKSNPLRVNVVQIREEHPPKGEARVEWILLTTKSIDTRVQVESIIDLYRLRWLIEEFHRALKSGCLLEKRHLESFEALTTMVAFAYAVACELLWLRARSRDSPNAPASEVLSEPLLTCLRAHPKVALRSGCSARDALVAIAKLGGYISRRDPPGWQTLGRGYHQLQAFAAGWAAAIATKATS